MLPYFHCPLWLDGMSYLCATSEMQVVEAVNGEVPVLLDGGIRRGTDVFKALALGAQAVLVSHYWFITILFSRKRTCSLGIEIHKISFFPLLFVLKNRLNLN